jgi:hypothetical protein
LDPRRRTTISRAARWWERIAVRNDDTRVSRDFAEQFGGGQGAEAGFVLNDKGAAGVSCSSGVELSSVAAQLARSLRACSLGEPESAPPEAPRLYA